MTINEFKAFLDGMDVQEAPSAEQWARIKAKIESLGVEGIGSLPKFPHPQVRPLDVQYPPEKPWIKVGGISCDDKDIQVHA